MNVFEQLARPLKDHPTKGGLRNFGVDPEISRRQREFALLRTKKPAAVPNPWKITWMQGEVLRLSATGCVPREVGEQMGIALHTVHAHLSAAKRNIKAKTLTHAAVLWDRHIRGGEK